MKNRDESIIQEDAEKESRRDFLKMAGKVALYTPPAILMLMQPNRDAIACNSMTTRHRWYRSWRGHRLH